MADMSVVRDSGLVNTEPFDPFRVCSLGKHV
jgi:hypothetical protein